MANDFDYEQLARVSIPLQLRPDEKSKGINQVTKVRRKLVTTVLAVLTSTFVTIILTGCFGNALQQASDQANQGAEGQVDTSANEGTIDGANGKVLDIGIGRLPKDFPIDQVPVIDAKIKSSSALIAGGESPERSWEVIFEVSDSEAAFAEANRKFESTAYAQVSESDIGTKKISRFENGKYTVSISFMLDEGIPTGIIDYLVTEHDAD